MSTLTFGMSFILREVVDNPKISAKVMLDGLFQVNIPGRSFHFVTKCRVIHSISFGELYDVRGVPDNKFVLVMTFNNSYPCELHAQNETERETVNRILQDIVQKRNVDVDEKLRANSIQKQAWVKKKGKVMSTKRLLQLNNTRRSLIVYKGEGADVLPSYHILLHNRVTIVPRKSKCIQIVGTYKNINVSFGTKELRNEWVEALQSAKEPPIKFDAKLTAPMFDPVVHYLPGSTKRYPQAPHMAMKARAGPSAD